MRSSSTTTSHATAAADLSFSRFVFAYVDDDNEIECEYFLGEASSYASALLFVRRSGSLLTASICCCSDMDIDCGSGSGGGGGGGGGG